MLFLIVASIIQLLLLIHVIKTGKNTQWIWAFLLIPFLSGIAYFFFVMLPELKQSRRLTATSRNYENVVNADFTTINSQQNTNSSFDTELMQAEKYLNNGEYGQAKALFEKIAVGKHRYDPELMYGAAKCSFELKQFEQSKSILDQLIQNNPEYENPEAHLLYARTLAGLNQVDDAVHEFETLHQYFTGPKASFYFAQFLKAQGQSEKANAIFNEILKKAKASGGHYDLIYYNIIQQVKEELDEV
ncbi:MAG: tetratricopeptide repeat protein [Pseudomonadota bacterium]